MSSNDLVFGSQPAVSGDLVFGATDNIPNNYAQIDAALPVLSVSLKVIPNSNATVSIAMPGMSLVATAEYRSNTTRPTVSKSVSDWQIAQSGNSGVQAAHTIADRKHSAADGTWQEANAAPSGVDSSYGATDKTARVATSAGHSDADTMQAARGVFGTYDALRSRAWKRYFTSQGALRNKPIQANSAYQSTYRDRRNSASSSFASARTGRGVLVKKHTGTALPFDKTWGSKYQEAITPKPGVSTIVVPPVNPKYTPDPNLVFSEHWTGSSDLLFGYSTGTVVPPATVVVPVKRAYIVINNLNIRRASDSAELPCYSLTMNLDTDSWAWSFTASLHDSALPLVEPSAYGSPVELDIEVNGTHYRVLAESLARERQFGTSRIAVSGRGKSAVLSDPYSPILTFSNSQVRTAQQLMADALTDNGVSIGWQIDFGIDDWVVPAGVFSHNGTYMSAIKAIAEAAGAYIQPDPVNEKLLVRPRYPDVPWNWNSLTADYSLPSAVTARESIAWIDKADYNAVYVSGVSDGVSSLVKKQGTTGGYLAPMVVDPLITDDTVARQRGISILGGTGRIANVMLSLPILPATGIIVPGKIIDYVDGGVTRRGITRSVSINATMPSIRQNIEVETHVY